LHVYLFKFREEKFEILHGWQMKQLLVLFGCISLGISCLAQSQQNDYTLSLGFNYKDQARKKPTFNDKETSPASFTYQPLDVLSITVASSLLVSKNSLNDNRQSGRGDTTLGGSFKVFDRAVYPAGLTLAYTVKFPTAVKGLGTDQYDHEIKALVGRKFSQTRLTLLELDGGVLITGRQAKSSLTTPQFSLIESIGLGTKQSQKYKWNWLHKTDFAAAAGGNAASVTDTNQFIYQATKSISVLLGPTYAFTPYDSRFGFAGGIKFNGHIGKNPMP
jgi:hypothetical protein